MNMKSVTVICLIFCSTWAFGQSDSIPDSLRFYRQVEDVAKKKKTTFWLFREIFNLPSKKKTKEAARRRVNYEKLQGRVIRQIDVQSLDPFGYSVHDTSAKPSNVLEKTLNFLHQRSTKMSITNQLLYEPGDTLDVLKVKESERISRSSSQIREIVTYVKPVKHTDSVDVLIKTQDYWSKSFGLAYSKDEYFFNFTDQNFLGLAHYWKSDLTYYRQQEKFVASGIYSVPYINHYRIIPTAYYSTDRDNFLRGVNIRRPFISPLFKWAGHAAYYDIKESGSTVLPEQNTITYATRWHVKDYWLGRSFSLAPGKSEEVRVTKLIAGARYIMSDFLFHAPEVVAPIHFYENTNFFLANIGLTNRSYYSDHYVYRFGVQEDVPTGRILNLVGGYETRGSGDRWYTGIETGTANYFDDFGYLSMRASFGSFIRHGSLEQSVVNIHMGYFSDLLEVKNYRFRQFVKFGVTYGFNRVRSESLNLNEEIKGLESSLARGIKKATLALQTQAYLPYSFLGFHFAPFFFISFGLINDQDSPLLRSRLYQGYGFGLIIKNELLVIHSFQVAIGFYPYIPDRDGSVLRLNPVKTYDFSFEDFEIQEPGIIPLE